MKTIIVIFFLFDHFPNQQRKFDDDFFSFLQHIVNTFIYYYFKLMTVPFYRVIVTHNDTHISRRTRLIGHIQEEIILY